MNKNSTATSVGCGDLVRLEDVPGTVRTIRWRRSSRDASAEADDLHDAMYSDGWRVLKGTDIADSENFQRTYWKPNDSSADTARK